MSRRMTTMVVVGLLVLAIGLELTGLATGLGLQTLPLLILLSAGLLVWRAVWPERAARAEEALHIPLEAATAARLDVTFGSGALALTAGVAEGALLAGTLGGAARHTVARAGNMAHVTLRQPLALVRRRAEWKLALSPAVVWDRLHVMLGAAQASLDLRGLGLEEALIEVGGTTLEAHLPASGAITLQISGGRATLTIPAGATVEIESEIKLGEVQVDEARFPPDASGVRWEAPGAGAPLTLTLKGGLGTVVVRGA